MTEQGGTNRKNVRVKGVQVDEGVYAGLVKSRHAPVVICTGIDVVNADCVGTQRLHEVGVAGALISVNQWVIWTSFCVRQWTL